MLARHETHVAHLEFAHDLLEFGQPPAALRRIVGGMREIARKHDEIRLAFEAVDRGDRLLQRNLRVGIGRALKTPVRIGQLHEIEIVLPARHGRATGQSRREHCAADTRELEKIPSVDRFRHCRLLFLRLLG